MVATNNRTELELLRQQVSTFYRVNSFISSINNQQQLLDLIMQEAEAAVEAEASCIGLYDPTDNSLKIEFASGEKSAQVQDLTLAMGQGILGQVAVNGRSLKVDHARQDPRFDLSVDQKTGFSTRCVAAVPISHHNQLMGVIEVINKRGGRAFSEEDVQLLEVVANQAAVALENLRLVGKLVQSERLSALGSLAASIVHDLRNPMTVVRGFTELLQNPEISPEDRRSASRMIMEDVDRMVDMCQDVLDFSNSEVTLNLSEICLGDWWANQEEYLDHFFRTAGIGLQSRLEYDGVVTMDAHRMRRVLMNLAANAREAMWQGGTFQVTSRQQGQLWELALTDTGAGIPPQHRAKIFEPFFTAGKRGGTGLGLAISRDIVARHGGAIEVKSRVAGEAPGEPAGTTFIIRIPVAPGQ